MSTSFRARAGLTINPLPDGDAVIATDSGVDAVIVNGTAHVIVELLAREMTEEDLASFMCETFPDQDPSVVRADVGKLVRHLVDAGIVEPCGTATSTA
jgi:hypothetical protein